MSAQQTEIRALNGLRGVAALSVALGHYHIGELLPVLSIFYWKDAAVDLFFVLSGFTLCYAYDAGGSFGLPLRNYLVARIARIYPLYLLTLVVASFVAKWPEVQTQYGYHVVVWDFVRQMLMVNAWSVISSGMHWNFPAWSVSVEFFCYLFVFPLLFAMSGRLLRASALARLLLSTLLLAASYYVYVKHYNWFILLFGRDPRGHIPEIAFSVNLIRGVLGFTAGCIVYASFLARDRVWRMATRHVDLIALGVLAALISGQLGHSQVQLMILGFPLLILGVSSGTSWCSRFLSWGPIHYLGTISYSVYLLHIPWFHFGWLRLGIFDSTPTRTLASTVVLLGGLICLAALSYRYIEMPARRSIRSAWQSPEPGSGMVSERRTRRARIAIVALIVAIGVVEAGRVGVFRPPTAAAVSD